VAVLATCSIRGSGQAAAVAQDLHRCVMRRVKWMSSQAFFEVAVLPTSQVSNRVMGASSQNPTVVMASWSIGVDRG
jgi:hypothetical protein